MRLLWILLTLTFSSIVAAAEVQVTVVEPYADMHTGPASEYPAFHAVERGEKITVISSHTGWYKVRTAKGVEGWIPGNALAKTILQDDKTFPIEDKDFDAFQQRLLEFSVLAGRIDNTNALSVNAAWLVTSNIAAEVSFTQALGDFSENRLWLVRLQHTAFPEWRLSPYFTIGAGQIQTTPTATLVQSGAETRTNDLLEVGVGARYYLIKQFSVRLEYKRLTALTEREAFEELNQWQLGFSVFF
ncbi:MAG: hypothetical protein CMF17_11505 [Idiomarinaceae bacterium]|nr:hypothetical protein [Idiomarinaceae bacterium]